MRTLTRALNVLSWPLWLKLFAGFVLAILIPFVLALFITQSSLNDTNNQRVRAFVEENGQRQQQSISDALNRAKSELDNFLANPIYGRQMYDLLSGGDVWSSQIASLFQTSLVGRSFARARLLDLDGNIMANARVTSLLPSGRSDAESPAYLQAKSSNLGRMIVTVNPDSTVEYAQAFAWRGRTYGYLIATLEMEQGILPSLALSGSAFSAYTFLVTTTDEPLLFTPADMRAQSERALTNSVAVARASGGVAETSTYRIGSKRDVWVAGYYAPILNPVNPDEVLFALVTEAELAAGIESILSYLEGPRAFVLIMGMSLILLAMVLLFNQLIAPPLNNLRRAVQSMARGDFGTPVSSTKRDDEIGALSNAFVEMRVQVRTMLDELEARIAARARDISATQAVSRSAATQRDLQTLLDQVVELIVKQFPTIYHAQIFLLDADRLNAVLRASTGEVGKRLLERGHRLPVGSVSVIGQVTLQGQMIIARDTAISQVHRRNEFLPDTRAELAIPLRIGDTIFGALDVQSRQPDAFTEDETAVLQTMADQIAVAIENARLYQESVQRLREIERTRRALTLSEWQEYLYSQRQRQLTSEAGVATSSDLADLRSRAMQESRIVVGERTDHNTIPVAVPIMLGGQAIGAVEWELPANQIDQNKLLLAQELVNRLAISLDNARLFEESQRAAERERIVNTIAAKLSPQTEIDTILQLAIREVGQALRAPQVSVRLHQSNGNGH